MERGGSEGEREGVKGGWREREKGGEREVEINREFVEIIIVGYRCTPEFSRRI